MFLDSPHKSTKIKPELRILIKCCSPHQLWTTTIEHFNHVEVWILERWKKPIVKADGPFKLVVTLAGWIQLLSKINSFFHWHKQREDIVEYLKGNLSVINLTIFRCLPWGNQLFCWLNSRCILKQMMVISSNSAYS